MIKNFSSLDILLFIFGGSDIKKHTDECLQVIEETIWDNTLAEINDEDSDI